MPIYAILNILTGLGYYYGHKFFGSVTLSIASANFIKIATVLIIAFIVLHEVPSMKVIIGLILILIGIIIAN
jgi:drug/metabolite transporter (DMT)-like permease